MKNCNSKYALATSGTLAAAGDYVIPDLTHKNWKTIKNSLPGSRSILDNTPRNFEILPGPVWPGSPHITIYPR